MSRTFYQSKVWKDVRKTIWLKQGCLCNKCGRAVYVDGISNWIPKQERLIGIVHHIEHITNDNVNDDNITINEDNLEGLCIDCHNKIHLQGSVTMDGVTFDDDGNLIPSLYPGK